MYIYPKIVIVCEGESDRIVIAHLARRILQEQGIDRDIEIIPAHGIAIIPRMVRAIEARMSPPAIGVIVDSDGHPARVWSVFRNQLPWHQYSLVMAEPTIESWVTPVRGSKLYPADLAKVAEQVPLPVIERSHPEFSDFEQLVLSHPNTVIHSKWVRAT